MTNTNEDRAKEENLTPNANTRDELTRLNDKGMEEHVRADVVTNEKQQRTDSMAKDEAIRCNPSTAKDTCATATNDNRDKNNLENSAKMTSGSATDAQSMRSVEAQSATNNDPIANKTPNAPSAGNNVSAKPENRNDSSTRDANTQIDKNPSQHPVSEAAAKTAAGNQDRNPATNPNTPPAAQTKSFISPSNYKDSNKASASTNPNEKVAAAPAVHQSSPVKTTDFQPHGSANASHDAHSKDSNTKPLTHVTEAEMTAVGKGTTTPDKSGSTVSADTNAAKANVPTPTKDDNPAGTPRI